MLDIKYIRENLQKVRQNVRDRGMKDLDPQRAVELYEQRNQARQRLDELRAERKQNAQVMKQKMEAGAREQRIERGRQLKEEIARVEEDVARISAQFEEAWCAIPNMTHPDVPVGREGEGTVLEVVGEPPRMAFEPKDHVILGSELGLIDFESAARVAGQKFYYLTNEAALLELALINFAMARLVAKGWTPVITPDLARTAVLDGIGFNPRGEETQIYSIAGTDLCLIATAEITLGGMHQGAILQADQLPICYVGLSHCFRTEAGAHGAASRGLYRVHQFSKVEMFAFTRPDQSEAMHERMRALEVELFRELGLCFRVVDIPTGDLGAPAWRKFDLEVWMPSRGDWGEITSTSNCTDYQSRRLGVRYRDAQGEIQPVHTLNGTAVAVSRALLAILENFQQPDGSVVIPEVLRPFMGGQHVIRAQKPWPAPS